MDTEDDVMRVGSNVIIDLNGSKYSFIRIRQNGTVRVAGSTCSTEPLIGARFGSAFLLDEQKELVPADTNPHETIANATGTDKVRLPLSFCTCLPSTDAFSKNYLETQKSCTCAEQFGSCRTEQQPEFDSRRGARAQESEQGVRDSEGVAEWVHNVCW